MGTCGAGLPLDNTQGKEMPEERRRGPTSGGSAVPKPLVPVIICPQWNTDIRGWDKNYGSSHPFTESAKLCYKLHSAQYLCCGLKVNQVVMFSKSNPKKLNATLSSFSPKRSRFIDFSLFSLEASS